MKTVYKRILTVIIIISFTLLIFGCSAEKQEKTIDEKLTYSSTENTDNQKDDPLEDTNESNPQIISPATTATSEPSTNKTSKTTSTKTENKQTVTVYITKTGEKYHRAGCRYLSKSCISINLKDAKANGYTPCKVCNPPR